MTLANELLLLRVSLGVEKQEYFASQLGISPRQYTRLERHGLFTRKMVAKIKAKYPAFASSVQF